MAQELNTKMVEKLPEGSELVRPFETVKIYATGIAAEGKRSHLKAGEQIEVHPLLAEKLIASGKATKTAPKAK